MPDPEDPKNEAIRASAHALRNVYFTFLEQAGDDQDLLDSLFNPTLTSEAEKLGITPEELLAEVTRIQFGPGNVFEQPDENEAFT